MAATTEPTASRSAINVRHLQYGVNGTPEKRRSRTQPDRRRLLQECMRQLDDEWLAKQVSRNANIVKEDSHLNYGFFNDGDGGWTEMTDADSIEDTVAYGDARVGSVHRKIHKNTFETTTIVSFLPKSLCQEIPDYYPVTRKNSKGEEKVVGHRSRWVPKDLDATKQYFEHLIEYLESNVLTGGHDAISGFAVNLDESVPHIHIMTDTFAPDPAHDGWLRVEAQQMWGQHKDVTEQRVDEETGETREVKITGRTKMRRYQEGLREFMLERGYDIEAEPDPVRSRTSLAKDTYAAAQSAVLAAEEFGEEASALYGEALNEAETAQVMADGAAKEMAAAKKLRDEADQQLKEARQTTERLTEEWERMERPRLVEEATAGARAEWESEKAVLVERAIEEGKSEGRTQGSREAKANWRRNELPTLRKNARQATEEAVREEMQSDVDDAAADRADAAADRAAARVRQRALDRRTSKLDEDEADIKTLKEDLSKASELLFTQLDDLSAVVGGAQRTYKTLYDMGLALPTAERQEFYRVTTDRFERTSAALEEHDTAGIKLADQIGAVQRQLAARLVAEDDGGDDTEAQKEEGKQGGGSGSGGDPQPD